MARTAAVIRHVAFEGLGAWAGPLARAGYAVHPFEAGRDDLSGLAADAPDLLIVLGGPISANDEARYPFLTEELALLRARLADDRPTLGVCLGAQLMARALGGAVTPAAAPEIGLAPLRLTAAGRRSPLAVFGEGDVLHWHGENAGLPEGCTRLAETDGCPVQAFARGPRVLGAQFHPEADGEGFERWLVGHAAELSAAGADVARLRAQVATARAGLARRSAAFLTAWLDGLARA